MNLNTIKKRGSRKGTIVMLHGNSSSSRVFSSVFESNIPYNLIAFDFHGQGDSEHNGKYKISDMINQIRSVIDEVDDDILLVGNSLGGHVALEIANTIPNLKGLLIFGTPPIKKPLNMEEAFLPNPAINTFLTENPTEEEINNTLNVAVNNKSVIPLLKKDFLRSDPRVRSVIVTEFAEFSDELSILSNLSCQKFIINGDQDPTVNPNYLEDIMSEGKFELVIIKECGHYPSVEKTYRVF